MTVHPAGEAVPLASNLNVMPGEVTPNLVVVKVGVGGRVDLFNAFGTVNLIADVAGWFPAFAEPTVRIHPAVGTVLAGAGDVISVVGNTLVLSGSADVPDVGGHLAVMSNTVTPEGLLAKVVAIQRNPTGTTTLTVTMGAAISDVFHDLEIDETWEPEQLSIALDQPAAPLSLSAPPSENRVLEAARPDCGANFVGVFGPTFSMSAGGDFDYSLASRFVRLEISTSIELGVEAAVSASISCELPVAKMCRPVYAVIVCFEGKVVASVSGSVSGTASVTYTSTIGFVYDNGNFNDLGGTDLSSAAEFAGASATLSVSPQLEASAKLLAHTGLKVGIGPKVTVTIDAESCVNVVTSLAGSGSLVALDAPKWFPEWLSLDRELEWEFANFALMPQTIYRSDECGDWTGTADLTWVQDLTVNPGGYDAGSEVRWEYEFTVGSGSCVYAETTQFGVPTLQCDGKATLTYTMDTKQTNATNCLQGPAVMVSTSKAQGSKAVDATFVISGTANRVIYHDPFEFTRTDKTVVTGAPGCGYSETNEVQQSVGSGQGVPGEASSGTFTKDGSTGSADYDLDGQAGTASWGIVRTG